MKRRSLGFLLAALMTLAGSARAQMTNDMDLVYARYHMAIRAAEACRGVHPTDAVWRKWSAYIDAKTHYELGAGERLAVIEGAKTDTRIIVRRQGCDSDDAKDLLKLYDAELAAMAK